MGDIRVENWNELQFDPRDRFANPEVTYVFEEKKWFGDNEMAYLEEMHPTIDIYEKIDSESFREWAFTSDPQLPLRPARAWFAKQERIDAATTSLMDLYAAGKIMRWGDKNYLIAALDRRK